MSINKILAISLIYLLCNQSFAHAYIDPGSGSIILQSILAFVATLSATISIYWQKIKNIFIKYFIKIKNQKKNDL